MDRNKAETLVDAGAVVLALAGAVVLALPLAGAGLLTLASGGAVVVALAGGLVLAVKSFIVAEKDIEKIKMELSKILEENAQNDFVFTGMP